MRYGDGDDNDADAADDDTPLYVNSATYLRVLVGLERAGKLKGRISPNSTSKLGRGSAEF